MVKKKITCEMLCNFNTWHSIKNKVMVVAITVNEKKKKKFRGKLFSHSHIMNSEFSPLHRDSSKNPFPILRIQTTS